MKTVCSALAAAVLAAGCSCEDPASGVPSARLEEPSTTPRPENDSEPSSLDAVPAGALTIDPARSTLEFIGSKVTGTETGRFGEWSGYIDLREPFESSVVRIDIRMASVQTERERLTSHLRTDDFFAVDQFPTARFETVAFAPAPDDADGATHLVTGRLTLRGVTQTITFPVTVDLDATEVRARAQFAIERQRWGVSYRGMEDDLIRDAVVIRFDVRAPRAR